MTKAILFAGALFCLNSWTQLISEKSFLMDLLLLPVYSQSQVAEVAVLILFITVSLLFIKAADTKYANSSILANTKALQVAHDIRAPLQLINLKLNEEALLKSDPVLRSAIYRMNAIANELLHKQNRDIGQCHIITTIQNIVDEQKYLHQDISDLFEIHLETNVKEATAEIDTQQFARIISNLLTNCLEARNPRVKIQIKAELKQEKLTIEIHDNGIGIPNDKLKKIQQGLISFGKKNGNGLGVKHALKYLQSIGSDLVIQSHLNVGTLVSFSLSVLNSQMLESIDFKNKEIILIEDEKYIRKFWEQSAINAGVQLRCFDSIKSFKKENLIMPPDSIYFLDSNLKKDKQKGQAFAEELFAQGAQNIYLVTGHQASEITPQASIKAVLDKTPPWR